MKKTALDTISGKAAAMDVYDQKGSMLIKAGTCAAESSIQKLKDSGIPFIYTRDADIKVSSIYEGSTIAELLKVLWYYKSAGGQKSELLKRYSIEEVKRFISYSKESSTKLAWGHIFGYFAARIIKEMKKGGKQCYDFQDYRSLESYNNFHGVNCACISAAIGYNMGLNGGELSELITGALLSDAKMELFGFVDEKRELSHSETEEMRTHTFAGFEAVRGTYGISSMSAAIVLRHHERHDGSGYPKGLKTAEIPLPARIAAVADVYDSMTSHRPFREGYLPEEAWEFIAINSGKLFDPDVVSEFKRTVPKFMPGDTVETKRGDKAVIGKNFYGRAEDPGIIIIEKTGQSVIISSGERAENPAVKTTLSIR
ncbi:MAG: HD domain-containing phosphohydrolase [Candidatus Goldiibacteriota bacterium]|jgi:HD-GYP domain-containing protein (c-di-GMP phosphodiesterase class II)